MRSVIPYILTCLITASFLIFFHFYLVSTILLAVAVFLCWFFRDPERKPPEGDNLIIAPCDGKVLHISRHIGTNFLGGVFCNTISIFMSPLNVHVNRSPVSGKIICITRRGGSFAPAFRAEASESNERNIIDIEAKGLRLIVVQVAGFLARRVECRVKAGDFVERGQRIGMIRFGSRVDLILPEVPTVKLLIEKGAKVRAGETVVAKWTR